MKLFYIYMLLIIFYIKSNKYTSSSPKIVKKITYFLEKIYNIDSITQNF